MKARTFFRINRKYIINIDSIESMAALSRSRIKLGLKPPSPDDGAIVSVERAKSFREWAGE
ncbi:MAG: LytTR family transcriptional regulator DNA-binding domain-containing protein [Candidatus Kapaibacterium sp.]